MSGLFYFYRTCYIYLENGVDPDQMLHSMASDLGLHYLPVSLLWDSRHKWVIECDVIISITTHHLLIQSNLNGSNIFGTMEIRSRHG